MELKSLKLYPQQYRNQGIFYEHAAFTPHGGITATVTATFEARK